MCAMRLPTKAEQSKGKKLAKVPNNAKNGKLLMTKKKEVLWRPKKSK